MQLSLPYSSFSPSLFSARARTFYRRAKFCLALSHRAATRSRCLPRQCVKRNDCVYPVVYTRRVNVITSFSGKLVVETITRSGDDRACGKIQAIGFVGIASTGATRQILMVTWLLNNAGTLRYTEEQPRRGNYHRSIEKKLA